MSSNCCKVDKKHNHSHSSLFGLNSELIFAIFSGVFFLIGFLLENVTTLSEIYPKASFIFSLIFGGYYIFNESIGRVLKCKIEIDFLMLIAAAGALYINRWQEASLLLFLFSLGHALEHFAMDKARKNMEFLGEISPKTAILKTSNGNTEVDIEILKIGDIIAVPPHTKIAADGVVLHGKSTVDQSNITGESMPVEKTAINSDNENFDFDSLDKKHIVYSSTINGSHALEIMVMKLSKDSTISHMIEMVNNVNIASRTQAFSKKFEQWYVPIVIIIVALLCFSFLVIDESYKDSIYRAITVLVAASPCALAISTPSAVLSGIARAAKSGVLIKGGRALEDLGNLDTIAFDKTGTLTIGKPKLTHLESFNHFDKDELINIILAVESLSSHPLARAITKDLRQYKLHVNKAENVEAVQGMGVKAYYNDKLVLIGTEKLMNEHKILVSSSIKSKMENLFSNGSTTMLVAYQNLIIGIVAVTDVPREKTANTIKKLKNIGIKNMVMLTGDNQKIGEKIAQKVGLTNTYGDLLPEDKVESIIQLKNKYGKVAMVGDGVNDAPAMANATIGIAMGAAGSDVALDTADIALMSDKIEKLPFAIGLSKASNKIITQNIIISMGMVIFLIPATLLGFAEIGPTVFLHEGSTLLVVFNALRLLNFREI